MVNKVGSLLGGNRREGTNDFSPDGANAADPPYTASGDAGFDPEATTIITPRPRRTEAAGDAIAVSAEPLRLTKDKPDAADAARAVYGDVAIGGEREGHAPADDDGRVLDDDRVLEVAPHDFRASAADASGFRAAADDLFAGSYARTAERDEPPPLGFAHDRGVISEAADDTMIEEVSVSELMPREAATRERGGVPPGAPDDPAPAIPASGSYARSESATDVGSPADESPATDQGAATISVPPIDSERAMTSDDLTEGLPDSAPAAHAGASDNLLLDLDDLSVAPLAPDSAEPVAPAADDGLLDLADETFAPPPPAPDSAAIPPLASLADEPPPSFDRNATTPLAPTAVAADQAASQSAPARLAPEDIEQIARRVVELMSDRLVREVAWEVVPELAERMIRRRIETDEPGL